MENSMVVLEKLKTESPYDPVTPLLGIYWKEMKSVSIIQKDIFSPKITAMLSTTAKSWKARQCPPVDEWIKKTWFVHRTSFHSTCKKRKHCYLQ
jgi:hypothetical protein